MTIYSNKESAGGALSVGDDILEVNRDPWRQLNVKRILTHVGIGGSAAAGDTKWRVVIGEKIVAELYNSSATVPLKNQDLMPVGHYVGSGAPVQLKCLSVSVTNPLIYTFVFKPWKTRRRRRTYRTRRFRRY